jgi:monofunctional biosynthetic peptidoglycan transglycosylase
MARPGGGIANGIVARVNARGRSGKRRGLGGWLRRIFWFLLAAIAGVYLLLCLALLALRWIDPVTTMVQTQRRIEAWREHKHYRKLCEPVPLSEISPQLQHAVIAAEDGRFYQHHGIDWKVVDQLIQDDLDEGHVGRGGSTITQQLVKNLFATTQRSWLRKGLEFSLAYVAETLLGKERILDLYLNVIEWGPGVYGAEAASQFYYHTPASHLTRDQAARLAAIIPSPRRRKPQRMNDYSAIIEHRMDQMGW